MEKLKKYRVFGYDLIINNQPDNLIWVVKLVDDDTGMSSHLTNIEDPQKLREYIALGKAIKLALECGYAPKSWSYENQARYTQLFNNIPYRFLS